MNNRYLEISSTYRNRFEYPNPAKFVVMLAQSGNMFTAKKAYNPVSENTPCYNFQGFGDQYGKLSGKAFGGLDCPGYENQFGPGTPGIPHLGCYDNTGPYFTSDKNSYYNGVTLQDDTILESSIIMRYNGVKKSCSLLSTFSDNWKSSDEWTLINTSSGGYQNFSDPKPRIITHGTPVESDYFNDYVLEDLSLDPNLYTRIEDRFKRIVKYDFATQHAYIGRLSDGNTNVVGNVNGSGFPINSNQGWNYSDLYRIRISPPIVMGHGKYAVKGINGEIKYNGSDGMSGTGPNNGSTGAVIKASVLNGGSGFQSNTVLRGIEVISKSGSGLEIEIVNIYNTSISNIKVSVPGSSYTGGSLVELVSPTGGENAIIKILTTGQSVDVTNGLSNSTTGSLSTSSGFYVNQILYIQSKGPERGLNNENTGGPMYYKQLPFTLQQDLSNDLFQSPPYSPDTTGCVVIDAYHTSSPSAKYTDGTSVPLTAWIVSSESFSKSVTGGNPGDDDSVSWEIQRFKMDSTSFLTYTGSTVSQNQMVCYQVRLVKLILPNVTLRNGIGGKISFYPYVYVELQNQTSPNGHQKNIIYSNNPNATTATFLVPIDNMPSPLISKFIHIHGNGAAQTIKFKPNDNLSFRVFLSDGNDLVTIAPDNAPPELPNPYLQITALFEIQRLA